MFKDATKPYLLDELHQKMVFLWKHLLQNRQIGDVTDTKLRNLHSLWLTKYQEWVAADQENKSERKDSWKHLVLGSLQKEFSNSHSNLLLELVESGLFFDTMELYLGILKEKIEKH